MPSLSDLVAPQPEDLHPISELPQAANGSEAVPTHRPAKINPAFLSVLDLLVGPAPETAGADKALIVSPLGDDGTGHSPLYERSADDPLLWQPLDNETLRVRIRNALHTATGSEPSTRGVGEVLLLCHQRAAARKAPFGADWQTGVLDLATGQMVEGARRWSDAVVVTAGDQVTAMPAQRHHFAASCLAVSYDEVSAILADGAPKPSPWRDLLRSGGVDEDTDDYLAGLLGQYITSDLTRQQRFILLYGASRAGKGTILELLKWVCAGTYKSLPNLATVGGRFGPSLVANAAYVMIEDQAGNDRSPETRAGLHHLKTITGGGLPDVEVKYAGSMRPYTARSQSWILACNGALALAADSNDSEAVVARLEPIKFTRTVPDDDREIDHAQAMIDEAGPDMIAYWLRCRADLNAKMLRRPRSVDLARRETLEGAMTPAQVFVMRHISPDTSGEIWHDDLRERVSDEMAIDDQDTLTKAVAQVVRTIRSKHPSTRRSHRRRDGARVYVTHGVTFTDQKGLSL